MFKYNSKANHFIEHIELILGCLICSLSFNIFLVPNEIASGGVVGISVILKHLFNFEPAITQWVLNIPLFFIGLFVFGKKYGIKTALGSFLLPLFIFLTKNMTPLTKNPILATVYGGVFLGIGLGIVFKGNGSTGGLSIIANIINKYMGVSMGKATMFMDAAVILMSGFVFSPEKALYSFIVVYLTGKAIDVVQLGFTYTKVAFVISEKSEVISNSILNNLERGLTNLSGKGGFTGKDRNVLMVVMEQSEVSRFKSIVEAEDPNAFIFISDTNEVLGQGFNLERVKK